MIFFSYKSFFLKINVIITPKSKQATAKPAFAFSSELTNELFCIAESKDLQERFCEFKVQIIRLLIKDSTQWQFFLQIRNLFPAASCVLQKQKLKFCQRRKTMYFRYFWIIGKIKYCQIRQCLQCTNIL